MTENNELPQKKISEAEWHRIAAGEPCLDEKVMIQKRITMTTTHDAIANVS